MREVAPMTDEAVDIWREAIGPKVPTHERILSGRVPPSIPKCWPCATRIEGRRTVEAVVTVVYWEDAEDGFLGDFRACEECFTEGGMAGRYVGTLPSGLHFRAYPVGEAAP